MYTIVSCIVLTPKPVILPYVYYINELFRCKTVNSTPKKTV